MKKHAIIGAIALSGIILSACGEDKSKRTSKVKADDSKASAGVVWETDLAKAKARKGKGKGRGGRGAKKKKK